VIPPILTVGIGHRFYSPSFGRWVSRDPMEERGGIGLYGSFWNSPLNDVDYLGLANLPIDPSWPVQVFFDYVSTHFEAAIKNIAKCHRVRVADAQGDDEVLIASVKIPSSISWSGHYIRFTMSFIVTWSDKPGSRDPCGSCWYSAWHDEYRLRRTSTWWRFWRREHELYTERVVDMTPYDCEAVDRDPSARCVRLK
jgi:hypothetical protein